MRINRLIATGASVTLALGLAACGAPSNEDDNAAENQKTSLNVGWNQPFFSYNGITSNGNATANNNIKYLMNGGFFYYDAEANLQKDESFGTYEQVSEDPLTVKYTVNDDTQWSDGTPVDAADLLLTWAAMSGNLNTVEADKVKRDEATGQAQTAGQQVYFDTSSPGLALVTQTPEISDDGKSLTLVYDKPFADWEVDMGVEVPAHVTAMKALGLEDAQEAKDALVEAVQSNDKASLAKIADFWNTGYDYTELPDDPMLYLSNGAYLMKEFVENQYMTLEKNPDYKGDHAASIDELTIRWNEDPLAQVQALENGEIDMFAPQVTADLVTAAEEVENAEIQTGVEGTYEHIDLVMNNKGPFDPDTYGGDAEKAKLVRQAFLTAVPRQEIVDKLVKPINAEAEVRNSFLIVEGAPGYDEMIAENGMEQAYPPAGDPAKAKQLLQQAGVSGTVDVRVMFAEGNVRRENEFGILKPALAKAGFNLIDNRNADWGSKLGDGTYDAVYFGWQSTSTAVSSDQGIYATGQINNLIGYSNDEVDSLFDELVVEPDTDAQFELQKQIEQQLVEDAIGATIFQFPSATIYNSTRVEGVNSAILAPTMFYGFWDWKVPGN